MAVNRPEGLAKVLKNLNDEIGKIEGRTIEGIWSAAFFARAEAQKRVPVETGNLKNSAFTRRAQDDDMAIEIGFSASYAPFVHENLEVTHHVGEAKFLENALRENQDEILKIIKKHAKINE